MTSDLDTHYERIKIRKALQYPLSTVIKKDYGFSSNSKPGQKKRVSSLENGAAGYLNKNSYVQRTNLIKVIQENEQEYEKAIVAHLGKLSPSDHINEISPLIKLRTVAKEPVKHGEWNTNLQTLEERERALEDSLKKLAPLHYKVRRKK